MQTAIVLFTRDLRVHDQPALAAAAREARQVIPVFVLEQRLLRRSERRTAFLLECVADLDESLRGRGGRLIVRRGEAVATVAALARDTGAAAVFLSEDVTAFAERRARELALALGRVPLRREAGVTVLRPGDVHPPGRDHYRVFTPYWRAWAGAEWRAPDEAPARVPVPEHVPGDPLPHAVGGSAWARGGETEGRRRARAWLDGGCAAYGERRDDLAGGHTSRLSPYLRFGCISPLELALAAGPGEFCRQLCWRDFYHQVLAANPSSETEDLVPAGYAWDDDPEALAAWEAGMTGYPVVDAGMRQLAAEGWMHNRARMIVASFLTKNLSLDWRRGATHFDRLLLDGDPANNVGGWQWVAGTGVDTRPGRMFNPTLQAQRFDPAGIYVRRYVPELASVDGPAVHEPWKLGPQARPRGYPAPIVDHVETAARYRARFARQRPDAVTRRDGG